MKHPKLRATAVAALAFGGLAAWSVVAQETPPASTFAERIEVTAVTVPILALGKGGPVPDLAARDLAVLEDGQAVPVIALERVPLPARPAATAAPAQPTAAAPETRAAPDAEPVPPPVALKPWRVLIYVDLQLTGIDAVREAAWQLGGEAERLAGLGEVEVWLADDDVRRVYGPGSDAAALRKALRKVVANHFGQRRLQRLRTAFLENTDRRPGLTVNRGASFQAGSGPNLARSSIMEEGRLLEGRRNLLEDLLAERSVPDWPQAAFVVSGGFDLVPSAFYLPMVGTTSDVADVQRLETEFAHWSQDVPVHDAARQLAALGWTVFPVIPYDQGATYPGSAEFSGGQAWARMGSGSAMSTPPGFLVLKPLQPWQVVGETTGGEVVADVRRIDDAVDRLGQRWLLTYQVSRRRDGSVHRLEVRATRPGLEVRAPEFVSSGTPEAVAAGRARSLLLGRPSPGDLAVSATVQPLAPGAAKGKRGRLEAKVDLTSLGAARAALTATTLRFTVAVPRADGGVTIIHETADAADLSRHSGWIYSAELLAAPATRQVAVVVEELGTGAWGSTVCPWAD